MKRQASFFIVTSRLNRDQALELGTRLTNFGFCNTYINHDTDQYSAIELADIVIVILPGDVNTETVMNISLNLNKPIVLVGHECGVDNSSSNHYENVFSINEISKSSEIIYKHLSELQNVYDAEELEQRNN